MALPDIRDIRPTKIVALGINYRDHADEFGHAVPDDPIIFLKPPSTLVYHGDPIVYPAHATHVDHEAELAVIIGRTVRRIPPEHALDAVLGYTCLNDVTERAMQRRDGQWTRAKSFDTFCPVGPRIVADIDPSGLPIASYVNGVQRQNSNTSFLIRSVPEIIAFVSSVMTLHPGDIIATGTPSGVGPLLPGDTVTIEIPPIGRLENPVIAEEIA